jgi:hypothetical protein
MSSAWPRPQIFALCRRKLKPAEPRRPRSAHRLSMACRRWSSGCRPGADARPGNV